MPPFPGLNEACLLFRFSWSMPTSTGSDEACLPRQEQMKHPSLSRIRWARLPLQVQLKHASICMRMGYFIPYTPAPLLQELGLKNKIHTRESRNDIHTWKLERYTHVKARTIYTRKTRTIDTPILSLCSYTYKPNSIKHNHSTPKVDQASRM
jgi:hypothetical protein